jgi:ABC-type branched-subunit amino acid transport system substrate-binding protein
MSRRPFILVTWLLKLTLLAAFSSAVEPPRPQPFSILRERQTEYVGPGRDEPPPEDVSEVLIGYFGPGDPEHALYGDLWRAATWAVADANRNGGYRGVPFRLVAAWSDDPWGGGVKELTRLVFEERVWAVIGGVDGPTTHLAEQIVVKARLPLISPVSTDKSVNLANVPWMFSLAPGDHLLAPLLADEIVARAGVHDFVLITADDHDSRVLTADLRSALARHHAVPRFQHTCRQTDPQLAELIAEVLQSPPAAMVIVADAADSARLIRALRSQHYEGHVFGGPALGRHLFLQAACPAAERAVFPLLYTAPDCPPAAPVEAAAFDYAAAHTFDAVSLTIEAIRRAGLNRARIHDAIRALDGWSGLTGPVHWDKLGSNTRVPRLGVISFPHQRLGAAQNHATLNALPTCPPTTSRKNGG